MRRSRFVWSVLILGVLSTACTATAARSFAQPFDAFTRTHDSTRALPDRQRAAAIAGQYDALFASIDERELRRLANEDVIRRYRAAELAAVYTLEPRHVQDLHASLRELRRRNLAAKAQYIGVYEAMIRARLFADARAFAADHSLSGLEPLPAVRDAAGAVGRQPTAWIVSPDQRELVRRNIEVRLPAQIVVISSVRCHFAMAAMAAIRADSTLREIFDEHAMWLAPPEGSLGFDAIQRWNREHTTQPFILALRYDDWRMIDTWNTPTFYFLHSGAVVAKVEGWPPEGRGDELLAAARRAGLAGGTRAARSPRERDPLAIHR